VGAADAAAVLREGGGRRGLREDSGD
jgi:hypothetical protein